MSPLHGARCPWQPLAHHGQEGLPGHLGPVGCSSPCNHPRAPGGAPQHGVPSLRYSVEGFLDKNKDTLFQDFKRLFYNRLGTQGAQLGAGLVAQPWGRSGVPSAASPTPTLSPVRTPCCMPCGLMASRASPKSPNAH